MQKSSSHLSWEVGKKKKSKKKQKKSCTDFFLRHSEITPSALTQHDQDGSVHTNRMFWFSNHTVQVCPLNNRRKPACNTLVFASRSRFVLLLEALFSNCFWPFSVLSHTNKLSHFTCYQKGGIPLGWVQLEQHKNAYVVVFILVWLVPRRGSITVRLEKGDLIANIVLDSQ